MSRNRHISRRCFLESGLLAAAVYSGSGCSSLNKRRPALKDVFDSYLDAKTGARVYNLTPGPAQDQVVYQTHPMWTPGMEYLLFHSDRSGIPTQIHAVEMHTGEIRPIVNERCGPSAMAWRTGVLYYLRNRDIFAVDVAEAFRQSATARYVGGLPAECLAPYGGITVDAHENTLYAGAAFNDEQHWGILAMDLAGGAAHRVVTVDFQVGHPQANPYVPGEILFCHETGGDAPQRTWFVRADGSGLRPFYKETYGEWVTHEVWWGSDKVIFTIWPYDDPHKELPHGIACANRQTGPDGAMEILSQYPAWHAHGSLDRKWAMGDDFDRNLWLINMATKERRLLTQGHLGKGFQTHPHASFSPDGRGIVFTSSRNSTEDIFFVELPPWETLPPPNA